MKLNDIEFLMYAMDCINSPNPEMVELFRKNESHVKRLADIVGQNKDELIEVIKSIKEKA